MAASTPTHLYLIQVASLPAPDDTPAVCYLVRMGDGTNVLIDSGMPRPEELPPTVPAFVAHPDVVEQLATLGLRPRDVDTLVCTHFDLDHVGRHAAFRHAPFVVQRRHLEAARSEPRFARTRPLWDPPGARFTTVDGDVELLPGLELVDTGGHVPGHQSVLVRLPETGPVLLAIDAVPDERSFAPGRRAGPRDMDEAGVRASTDKLLDLARRERVALTVFGHDGAQWRGLRKLPEAYR